MKKVLFIIAALLMSVGVFSQRTYSVTIPVPQGSDTTFTRLFGTGNPWSIQYWYESLDDTDGTLALYGSNFPSDSSAYELLFIDKANDGTNDNPKTLSDTVWVIWGESFPFTYLIQKFTKGSNTAGSIYGKSQRQ